MPSPKPVVSVESINEICYDLAHNIGFREKSWLVPAFKSHVHHLAQRKLVGYEYARVEHLIDQWIAVRQGKFNPVPRTHRRVK